MQPPPFPDGSQIRPDPTTLPLCAKNSPSPPRLVSLPSKTGDLERSSWYLNQFQYCDGVSVSVLNVKSLLLQDLQSWKLQTTGLDATYRQMALIATLASQLLLPDVHKIAMPWKEVGRAVDEVGLVHVHGDIVIEMVLGRRELGIDGRKFPQAFYCFDVVLFLTFGKCLPR